MPKDKEDALRCLLGLPRLLDKFFLLSSKLVVTTRARPEMARCRGVPREDTDALTLELQVPNMPED